MPIAITINEGKVFHLIIFVTDLASKPDTPRPRHKTVHQYLIGTLSTWTVAFKWRYT